MGKPRCTDEAIRRAVFLKKGGANNKDIAAALGVHERTFYKWLNEPKSDNQRQLGHELKKAEADYKNALLSIIAKNAQERDWKAAAWLLERKYPSEYARRTAILDGGEEKQTAPRIVDDIGGSEWV